MTQKMTICLQRHENLMVPKNFKFQDYSRTLLYMVTLLGDMLHSLAKIDCFSQHTNYHHSYFLIHYPFFCKLNSLKKMWPYEGGFTV